MARAMMAWAAAAAAGALLTLPSPTRAQTFTPPDWMVVPDVELGVRLRPRFADLIAVGGEAVIRCQVYEDGHAFDCRVLSETPGGLGFGSAARLVVASGMFHAGRIDGQPVTSAVRTTVNFGPCCGDLDTWEGPEPGEAALALARELVRTRGDELPPVVDPMEGLDYDRRPVVSAWLEELGLTDRARDDEITAIQFARLYDETDLRRMLAREPVEAPTLEAWRAAYPAPTEAELAAMAELRRRYCARWDCGDW